MTVKELIDDLNRFPDNAKVIFTPQDVCGGGYPEWTDASVGREWVCRMDDSGNEIEVESETVTVTLMGECE